MKIGILTFHSAYNYGAFLQTYGLQKYLCGIGHDVTIIDYCPEYLLRGYRPFSPHQYDKYLSRLKNILAYPYSIAIQSINYKQTSQRRKYFNDTIYKNLKLSEKSFPTYDELSNTELEYDTYILGSDQIWTPHLTDGKLDPAFFLYNISPPTKTYTYAASMGKSSIPDEHVDDFKKYSQNLNTISIRECSATHFVREQTGKDVHCVLDPTLLLTADEWDTYSIKPGKHPKKYLLSYYMSAKPEYFRAVKNIAKKSDLEVVWIHNTGVFCKYFVKHNYVRPEEFVWYFANASAVITDSFHGTMFSIINRKPFYSVAPYPQSVRIEDHLKRLGLLDRLYDSADKLPDIVTEIDYTKPCEKLEEWRQKSFAYLDMITKPDDEQ